MVVMGMKIRAWVLLLVWCSAHAQARDLEHGETTTLIAEVHVASYNNTKSIFLTVANDYHNTVSCSGEVMVITDARGTVGTQTLAFSNLRVYPRNAFPYRITYPIAGYAHGYADASYAPIRIECKSWDFLITLPAGLCQLDPDAHAKNCDNSGHVYPLMIDTYWLGSCAC
ncbi:MAG: hypothetical protein OYH77_02295 [Pseudomonadota bacterium]|nr:hypothetical protein [Pseudomonadota bacterium]